MEEDLDWYDPSDGPRKPALACTDAPRPLPNGFVYRLAASKLGKLAAETCASFRVGPMVMAGAYALLNMLNEQPEPFMVPRSDDPFVLFAACMISHKLIEDSELHEDPQSDRCDPIYRPVLHLVAASLDLSRKRPTYVLQFGETRGCRMAAEVTRQHMAYYEERILTTLGYPSLTRAHLRPFISLGYLYSTEQPPPICADNGGDSDVPDLTNADENFIPKACVIYLPSPTPSPTPSPPLPSAPIPKRAKKTCYENTAAGMSGLSH
jgi:hypothetical protein